MEIKIAFCFLTYNKIIRYDIWNTFFNNIDLKKYIVIIHPKYLEIMHNYNFPYIIMKDRINTTGKDNITIVEATLKLLDEANKQNATHFIFLSQNCIPLYTFDILYNIISNLNKSIISCIYNNKNERYNSLSNNIKKIINKNDFVKQQPNMILIKEDIELLLSKDYTDHFKLMQCPDEHYFINILINVFKKDVIKKQTHFCNFNFQKTQALEYKHINSFFIQKLRDNGFLFMRKVMENSLVEIDFLFKNIN